MRQKIACIVGTRPEAIKMAPVHRELVKDADIECIMIATAQHRELLDDVFETFGITADIDLDLMKKNQSLAEITSRCITELDSCLSQLRPDIVLAQGDTTTVMAAAMTSFYNKIPFGHVEAGLRSGNMYNPFPEEMNRVVASRFAKWHFAPTEYAKANLLAEGTSEKDIYVTGNTVIDALLHTAERDEEVALPVKDNEKLILFTAHRRENFGAPFDGVCSAVRQLVDQNPEVVVLYPMHPNPNIRETAMKHLGDHKRISLCDPLNYREFVSAMKKSYLILSDSGGVQEEAPALGVPVLVLRTTTERPEAVDCGAAKLVGTETKTILKEASTLLHDPSARKKMIVGSSPYGDGKAAPRIVSVLKDASI